jgi:hypothetical protein
VTQAIPIPSAPSIIPVAQMVTPEMLAQFETIEDVPYQLQAMETVAVFLDSNGNIFHLNGPQAGKEGVKFYENLKGEHHVFFEQVTVEGAYMLGGIIDRVNYLMRRINFRVHIGMPGMNNITYRMCEDRWWAGQDEINGGWFGIFTRYSGWRWIHVWPAKTVETSQKRDPVAYDNNQAIWDVDWIAPTPFYSKPAITTVNWKASMAGPADANGFYWGTIAIPNRADMATPVRYLITGANAGTALLQDNNSHRMVTVGPVDLSDGDVVVDTDPIHKTVVAANDPFDVGFFNAQQQSGLLGFFLQAITTPSHSALWLRLGYVRFLSTIPPYSVVHLKVAHNNPNAQIAVQLPQRYKRSR